MKNKGEFSNISIRRKKRFSLLNRSNNFRGWIDFRADLSRARGRDAELSFDREFVARGEEAGLAALSLDRF